MSSPSRSGIQRLARVALFSALALVLSYIETMIPLPTSLPGIKLGLANIAVVVALFALDWRTALAVAAVKVFAAGFLFGSPMMLAYSLGGTALAFLGMVLLKRIPGISVVIVSMVSAILHNVGQILVAMLMLGSPGVLLSLPPLVVAACVTGALTGAVAAAVLNGQQDAEGARPLVDCSDLHIEPGEHIAFVGANGSGKTSCALQLAGLADGDGSADAALGALDGVVGVAFQDPDSQIVSASVRDDVAFGPENRGIPRGEMVQIVEESLERAGASDLVERDTAELSGGQKQRVAVAGLLALAPGLVIFDESTAMLDPRARDSFRRLVDELLGQGLAVITITQIMDEAFLADSIAVFDGGSIRCVMTPSELASQPEILEECGLELPHVAALARELRDAGIDVPMTNDRGELEDALCRSCAQA